MDKKSVMYNAVIGSLLGAGVDKPKTPDKKKKKKSKLQKKSRRRNR